MTASPHSSIGASRIRGPAALLVFTLAVGLVSIWNRDLCDTDDPRVAGIARGMALSGDYAIPRLNGRDFLEYPSLGYVPIALFIRPSENPPDFLALLPAVLLGAGTVLLTYRTGKILGGGRVGILSGFVLASSAGFISLHSSCLVDPSLLFWITFALHGFVAGRAAERKSFLHFALFYLGTSAALLSKGLLGLAVPVATVAVFLCLERDFATLRRMRPLAGIAVFCLPILAWAAAAYARVGLGPLLEVLRQSLWRGFSSTAHHSNPFWYYLVGPIFVVLMPWTLLVLVAFWLRWRRRERIVPGAEGLFPLVWFCVTFAGLTVASAKRTLYLAPLLPAFAILAAMTWNRLTGVLPRLRSTEVWFALGFLPVFAAVNFLILLPREMPNSLRPTFELVARERQGGSVMLFSPKDPARERQAGPVAPKESMSGAAVFYLGGSFPETLDPAEVAARLAGDSGRWIVVSMYKKGLQPLGTDSPPPGLRLLQDRELRSRFNIAVYVRPAR